MVFFLHGARYKDPVAASFCTVTLLVRPSWSLVSTMTRARHVQVLSRSSTVLNSMESLAQGLLITSVDNIMCVVGYHIEEGIQPMISRLRMMRPAWAT